MPWTIRDDLTLSIRIGLTNGFRLVRGLRRQLDEAERDRIAGAIAEQLELSNWKIEKAEPLDGHGSGVDIGGREPERN